MKIRFLVNDPELPFYKQEKFDYDFPTMPRIGERVVRHNDESVSLNDFIVEDVVYVAEFRDRYVERSESYANLVVVLRRKVTE